MTSRRCIGLAAIMLVWFVVFERLVWNRHAAFATFDFDLGHHDQAIWLLSRGKGFITVSGMPVLGHHFTVAYFALAPLYWLGGGPQLLDVLQNAALALAAVPIYLLARDLLQNAWWALALAAVWLLNPSVQWLAWETWHPETVAIPFFLAAYLMASRRRWTPYWLLLVATLAWKEDIALAVARARHRDGHPRRAPHGVADARRWPIVWFVVAYGIVMPHLNGGTNHAGTFYGELGDSPTEIVRTMLTEPDVVIDRLTANDALGYARDLLAPFGFLPLLAPLVILIAVPQFLANVLTNANFFYDIRFHYAAIIVAVLALATVEGIAWLRPDELATVRRRLRRRLCAGHVGGLGHLTDRHPVPHRLLAAPRQRPPGDARRRRRHGARRRGRVGRLPHRPPPLPPHADLHVPEPVDPAQLGRQRRGARRSRPRPHARRGGMDRRRPDGARPESREAKLLATLLEHDEFEVVSDVDGIVVARRVKPPVGRDRTRRSRRVERSSGAAGSAASADSTPLTKRPLLSVEKRLASSTASSMTTATGHVGTLGELEACRAAARSGRAPASAPASSPSPWRRSASSRRSWCVGDALRRAVVVMRVGLDDLQLERVDRRDPLRLAPRRAGSSARSRASDRGVRAPRRRSSITPA